MSEYRKKIWQNWILTIVKRMLLISETAKVRYEGKVPNHCWSSLGNISLKGKNLHLGLYSLMVAAE